MSIDEYMEVMGKYHDPMRPNEDPWRSAVLHNYYQVVKGEISPARAKAMFPENAMREFLDDEDYSNWQKMMADIR